MANGSEAMAKNPAIRRLEAIVRAVEAQRNEALAQAAIERAEREMLRAEVEGLKLALAGAHQQGAAMAADIAERRKRDELFDQARGSRSEPPGPRFVGTDRNDPAKPNGGNAVVEPLVLDREYGVGGSAAEAVRAADAADEPTAIELGAAARAAGPTNY